ncbi:MAG: DNA-3-methyladenine glycosylase 2 family protein [Candidatus Bathyarchaeota archaeon]|uniref:DNA-3-methyladenine glycosylase family protein n=1 Tax=Candidatus Bathycorpusculum sp. TaxID=2994959 RepID=UPI0028328F80|nr:DNA-3-methyladenine glycosylase 2 family protein [Candidatus Termiticorpusculum sp.]MCL2257450.1 DNA-3-methyladenine glycosylase 2 family protein [Candidatus Termiticorpusculum sp.]MCL2292433.1 DNA-3-methyladenine glycosylase 2 family protein [Candidatus Termiticorpusculum sp.]
MTYKTVVKIEPLAPFDLLQSSLVFATGDRRVKSFQEGCFSQVINIEGRLVLVKLFSEGEVDKPKLSLELYSDSELSERTIYQTQEVVSQIFSLNMPLTPFYEHVKYDRVMSQITQLLRGFKFPTLPTVFEALVYAIVEQQISIKVARNIEERLAVMFGNTLNADGTVFFAFPTASALIEADVEKIRQAGLSARKASYIHEAAQLVCNEELSLEKLQGQPLDNIVSVLDDIRGVGVWTAELTILRGMGRFDVLPADDFGIRRVISRYYCGGEKTISAIEARKIAEKWGNWRGLAAFYLIAAEALNIQL